MLKIKYESKFKNKKIRAAYYILGIVVTTIIILLMGKTFTSGISLALAIMILADTLEIVDRNIRGNK